MTDDKITLQGLLEKSSDASFLREMIGFAAQRLMELEVDTLCGAAHGERIPIASISAPGQLAQSGGRLRAQCPPRHPTWSAAR